MTSAVTKSLLPSSAATILGWIMDIIIDPRFSEEKADS